MSHTANDSTGTYAVNLTNPTAATINLMAFYNAVKLDASKRVSIIESGLLQFVQHTGDFTANPANRDADGTILARPSNPRPILPAGANAAAISMYNLSIADYQTLATSILLMSDKIYNGLSPATQSVMNTHAEQHPQFFLQPWAMMDFIFLRHGVINADHVLEAKRTLRVPFDNVANTLESHKINMDHQFDFLHRARHTVNDGDKMDQYEASVSTHPHIIAAIRLFKNATFANMTAYVELHAPDQLSTSADLGYANYSKSDQRPLQSTEPLRQKNRSKRPQALRGQDPTAPRHYCYIHGYGGHKGSTCRVMLADTSTYTTAHVHASIHTAPAGGSDSNL